MYMQHTWKFVYPYKILTYYMAWLSVKAINQRSI